MAVDQAAAYLAALLAIDKAQNVIPAFDSLVRDLAFLSMPSRIRAALHLSVAQEEKMEAVVDGRLSELVEETGALGFAPPQAWERRICCGRKT